MSWPELGAGMPALAPNDNDMAASHCIPRSATQKLPLLRLSAGTRHGRNFIPTLGWVLSRAEAERQASSGAAGGSTANAGLAVNSHEGMGLALGLLMVAQVNRWRELARLLSPVNPTSRTAGHVRVANRCSTAPQLRSVLSGSAERVSRRTASTPLPGAQLSMTLPPTGSEAPIASSAGEGSSSMVSVNFASRPSSQELLDPDQSSSSSGASSSNGSAVLPPVAAEAAAAAAAKCMPDSLHLSAGLGTPNCSAWDLGVRPPMVSVSGPLSLAEGGANSVSANGGGLASVGATAPAPPPMRAVFANRAAAGSVLDPDQPSSSSGSYELSLKDAEEPGSPLLLGKLKTIKLDEVSQLAAMEEGGKRHSSRAAREGQQSAFLPLTLSSHRASCACLPWPACGHTWTGMHACLLILSEPLLPL